MGKLSTPLAILAALLAIGAAVLSYFLFERRNEFRGRADRLATTVASMAAKIGADSSTTVPDGLTFTPGDPASGTAESGTLGWQEYHNAKGDDGTYAEFQTTLDKADQLAAAINEQRNRLADALADIATDFQAPEDVRDAIALKDLGAPDTSKAGSERILQLSKAVQARDGAMIDTLVASGKALGYSMQPGTFWERKQETDEEGNVILGEFDTGLALAEFSNKVKAVNGRCNAYADTLIEGIGRVSKHDWTASTEKITNEDEYAGALTALLNDFDDINDKLALFAKAKRDIQEYKLKVDELENEIEEGREKLLAATQALERLQPAEHDGTVITVPLTPEEQRMSLVGQVLQVNPDWNYIILDLGRTQVTEQTRMLVARDNDLVARVRISKVLRKISIAEVLPEIQTSQVRVGDRVIMPFPEEETPEALR